MANNLCASNLTSGFIDLATYDEQEKYLYGGPDSVAYFVREIRKATWFTQVPVILSRSSGQPDFGAQWSVSISRAGDYLLHSWLRLTLGSITAAAVNPINYAVTGATGTTVSVLRWTRNFMHNLIQECNITFNDLVAARFDNYHLDFWAAFTVPAGKRNGYNNMIGNIDSLVNPVAAAGLPVGAAQVLPSAILNLPLPFFYTRDTGLALPTAALPYNEMRINFAFQQALSMLIVDTYTISGVGSGSWSSAPASLAQISSVTPPSMSNVQVWANYAIVSNEERKKMACAPRDILIEQVQTAPIQSFTPVTNSNPVYDIRFSHAIKALFFAARNTTNGSSWSNYTTSAQVPLGPAAAQGAVAITNALFGVVDFAVGSDPIVQTSLIYESTQRLYQMGSDYFSLVNPWYEAPVIPLETGYHVYSYSLDFYCIDPMGSTNYGKLTNVSIAPIASADAISAATASGSAVAPSTLVPYAAKFSFITTALNNNIIRISGGALGFPVL